MVGLHSGTHSKLAVIGGILTIAIADAFSDALGIHISEESEGRHASKEIWESTLFTFSSKLAFALTFLIPVLLLELWTAVVVGIVWGLLVISLLSYRIAREQKGSSWKVVSEHLIVALVVIVAAHYVGDWLSLALG
jgi:VIT1/CCC1 family predicted Fe2+/Mn2+ transporter